MRPGPAAAAAASVLALLAAPQAAAGEPAPKTYHVAPQGEGQACNVTNPCSPTTARDKVRQALAEGMDRDIEVRLADGTYPLDAPLTLGAADSGRDGHTVTWTAEPGAHPVLSGGRTITGWRPAADGRWSAAVPDGAAPRQLFVDGVRAVRARSGPCPVAVCDATATGMTGAVASGAASWARPTAAEAVIRVRWRNYHCRIAGVSGDLITFVQPCWINSASGTARTGPAWDSTAVDSSRYTGVSYFENAVELLDTPGEFAWDPDARTVTYLPRPGEDMTRAVAVTPSTEHLVVLDGAHDLRLSGLTFSYAAYTQPDTDEGYAGTQAGLTLTGPTGPVDHAGRYYTKPAAAVTVRGGRNVVIEGSAFSRLGGAGVVLEHGTRDSSVIRSTFTDLSSGAVYVGDTEPDPPAELTGLRNTVAYNTIDHTGVEYSDSVGIWAGYEAELTIDHNSLDHLPYSGISVGWGWNQPEARNSVLRDNRITDNRVTDAMLVAYGQHDGGAIYTQGAQPGTVISGNYLNRSAYGNTERDGNGIYLDEQSSHILVQGNVLTRVGYKWVSNWADYGIDNLVTGNWTDTDAPALAGTGSAMVDNAVKLEQLPAEAVRVAAAAGAHPGAEPVEQLRPDLARAGTATQSSTAGTAAAGRGNDGDTTTDTGTASEAGAWWQVDLGSVQHIGQVEIWNGASAATADFDVRISSTPDFADATTVHVTGRALRPTLVDTDTTGRYVRIQRTGTGRIALAQVSIHP
ncbi:right-handed parallel beta-helix repeat-containing protein [Streptacidiphilus griseoplanus]|uniref:right-handed parallel beta-helix repeat-containing protein n=1 Tax=Peterkaempfera griseoplana TaxID=66896 RepID=UPI00099F2133|nr:right-handed parallel beta-helix repeat-containing protein [Peterkaempfera griseoplana]